jgi:hypothetical protein
LSIWAISTGSSDFHSAINAFCGTACYRSGQQQGQRGSNLVDGRFLREHGVKQDVVWEVINADVVLERDLQLSGSGAGRLCPREGRVTTCNHNERRRVGLLPSTRRQTSRQKTWAQIHQVRLTRGDEAATAKFTRNYCTEKTGKHP